MKNLENKRLYIAYGSNLHLEQMKHRCPTAKVVGKGVIEDYELLFRQDVTSAVATVEPLKNSKVPVLIWEIQQSDEDSLDIYEGYPDVYRKENIKVNVNGEEIEGMIYLMNEKEIGIPSDKYLKTIEEGYKTAGFDLNILMEAFLKCKELTEK
ncbi:MAG: gamma-glutamylcyclotransferase [Eubacteriales bacterium]|nr:gamma-glutamylcyclotransferase [Eubacteriales bacterium]